MARCVLFLKGKQIIRLADLRCNVLSADLLDKFRSGAIHAWLAMKPETELAERFAAIPKTSSDTNAISDILQILGEPENEAKSAAIRFVRERNEKKRWRKRFLDTLFLISDEKNKTQTDFGKRDSVISANNASCNKKRCKTHQMGRYSLQKAFSLAVTNGDIDDLCKYWLTVSKKPRKTAGGKCCWDNLAFCNGWRLQFRNTFQLFNPRHIRIIDPDDLRHGHGRLEKAEAMLRQYWDEKA